MKRRDFLKGAAVVSAVAGCSTVQGDAEIPHVDNESVIRECIPELLYRYVLIDPVERTIELKRLVTMSALYSYLKYMWKNEDSFLSEHSDLVYNSRTASRPSPGGWRFFHQLLMTYSFPLTAITAESFEFEDPWRFKNHQSRQMVREACWKEGGDTCFSLGFPRKTDKLII